MDINQQIKNLEAKGLLFLFFKAFAVILSFLYLIYAVVILRQTQVMNRTLTIGRSPLILFISFLQIVFGVVLVILAIYTV